MVQAGGAALAGAERNPCSGCSSDLEKEDTGREAEKEGNALTRKVLVSHAFGFYSVETREQIKDLIKR